MSEERKALSNEPIGDHKLLSPNQPTFLQDVHESLVRILVNILEVQMERPSRNELERNTNRMNAAQYELVDLLETFVRHLINVINIQQEQQSLSKIPRSYNLNEQKVTLMENLEEITQLLLGIMNEQIDACQAKLVPILEALIKSVLDVITLQVDPQKPSNVDDVQTDIDMSLDRQMNQLMNIIEKLAGTRLNWTNGQVKLTTGQVNQATGKGNNAPEQVEPTTRQVNQTNGKMNQPAGQIYARVHPIKINTKLKFIRQIGNYTKPKSEPSLEPSKPLNYRYRYFNNVNN